MIVTARQYMNMIRARMVEADEWYGVYENIPLIHKPRDSNYLLPSLLRVKQILHENRIDKLRYIPNAFDCDKFALCIKAEFVLTRAFELWEKGLTRPDERSCTYAVGYADSPKHRLNIVTTAKSLYLISGQTDRIWRPTRKDNIKEIWP